MPNYKLTYFNVRSRAEPIRLMFAVAGVEYEDIRVGKEEWAAMKPAGKAPFGQLPILEIGDKVVAQSKAISRYLAREYGLYGSNSWETLQIDVITELCDDLANPYVAIVYSTDDEETKKQKFQTYYEETAPKWLKFLEEQLCQNNDGNGYFVGDKLSVADITFLHSMDWIINPEHPDVLETYPKLRALRERVKSNEKIADWLRRRPVTPR